MPMPKHILVGISGSIAAYKSAELVRLLHEREVEVRVVMTEAAKQFITPLTLQTVSNHPVYDSLWNGQSNFGMDHIELARWPELMVIAPATADLISKMAMGLADDLLSTLLLASTTPIFIAPAMNQNMWQAPATQNNIRLLKERGIHILGPEKGEQACGEVGFGRMLEPEAIVEALCQHFAPAKKPISILITAGPTQEPLDPIRFLSNRSSGKMGFALAEAAYSQVEQVTLVTGPVNLETPNGVKRHDVETADEMQKAVMKLLPNHHILIGTAAVSDYGAQTIALHKIKKSKNTWTPCLKKTPDILSLAAKSQFKPFCVGFSAETQDVLKNARQKLIEKKLDLIIANTVGRGKGFQSDYNEVTVLWADGQKNFPRMLKTELGKNLIELILERYTHSN